MGYIIFGLILLVAFALQTAVLAGSLFMVEGDDDSSFKNDGVWLTLAKCAGIVLIVLVLRFVPFGGLVAIAGWFLGIMAAFQKSFGQTVLLFVVNLAISMLVGFGIGVLVTALLPESAGA